MPLFDSPMRVGPIWSKLRKQPKRPPHTSLAERRIGIVRFGALFGAAVTGFYLVYNLSRDWFGHVYMHGLELRIEAIFLAIFVGSFFMARRFRLATSYLLLLSACAICVLMTSLFGRLGGAYYFLLTVGPMSALMYEARRPYATLIWSSIATILHLALHFVVPPAVDPYFLDFSRFTNPFAAGFVFHQYDLYYIIDITAIEFGTSLCAYLAMHWATAAEAALVREYARSELLLQNLLPASIAARLKDNPGVVIADRFDSISILFADVVNFTPMSAVRKPEEIVNFLSRLFGEFDLLARKHGLEKIKTIGDAYMVAGGMPEQSDGHAQSMADMALEMIEVSQRLMVDFDDQLSIRIGLHVGPATAGVIGRNKPYYDVWGDTINVAARMESFGVPGRIQITPEVRDILGERYSFEHRGEVDVKGKGPMNLYFLVGRS